MLLCALLLAIVSPNKFWHNCRPVSCSAGQFVRKIIQNAKKSQQLDKSSPANVETEEKWSNIILRIKLEYEYCVCLILQIDKPESKSQVQAQIQIEKGKRSLEGLQAVSKILRATNPTPPTLPPTFKQKQVNIKRIFVILSGPVGSPES